MTGDIFIDVGNSQPVLNHFPFDIQLENGVSSFGIYNNCFGLFLLISPYLKGKTELSTESAINTASLCLF